MKIFKDLIFLNIPVEQVVKKLKWHIKKKSTQVKKSCDKISLELELSQTHNSYFVSETPIFFLTILRVLKTQIGKTDRDAYKL